MSAEPQTTASGQTGAGAGVLPGLLLLVVVAAVGYGVWSIASADPDLDASVIGLAGLAIHLDESGRETRVLNRRVRRPDAVALRILPVFDPDISRRDRSDDSHELAQELRRVSAGVLAVKVREAPTLVVMTKWRRGAQRRAIFHPDYLVDAAAARPPAPTPTLGAMPGVRIEQAPATFQTERTSGALRSDVTLYAAQTLALPTRRGGENGCDPAVWLGPDRYARTLLARCRMGSTTFHLLSDPDLLNNAGLAVGGNAAFALALVNSLAPQSTAAGAQVEGAGAPVFVDQVRGTSFVDPIRRDRRGRSFSDLMRFFEWPFSLVWGALAVLVALGLWRAALRFGPAIVTRDRFHAASKSAMIDTNARILSAGMAGGDAGGQGTAMMREHARYRLSGLARDLFGRAGSETTMRRALARRAPALAERLDRAVARIETGAPARWIEEFETVIAGIENEFGRRAGGRQKPQGEPN